MSERVVWLFVAALMVAALSAWGLRRAEVASSRPSVTLDAPSGTKAEVGSMRPNAVAPAAPASPSEPHALTPAPSATSSGDVRATATPGQGPSAQRSASAGKTSENGPESASAVGREVPPERVEPAQPFALNGAGLRGAVQSVMPELRECYDGWLKVHPQLKGTLKVRLVIAEDPDDPTHAVVTTAEVLDSELAHTALEGCLLNALSEPEFEPPEDGKPVEVHYPFAFASEPPRDQDATHEAR